MQFASMMRFYIALPKQMMTQCDLSILQSLWYSHKAEMKKVEDPADISVLFFFPPGANFWAMHPKTMY